MTQKLLYKLKKVSKGTYCLDTIQCDVNTYFGHSRYLWIVYYNMRCRLCTENNDFNDMILYIGTHR